MIEKIYTIPINEAFEEKCGCPVCRLYARAREKALDYITGSAMMEPTVRIQSNEEGFCREHLADMLAMKTKLSLGLMLESRLDEVQKQVFRNAKGLFGKGYDGEKLAAAARKAQKSCFVCNRIADDMEHYIKNIVFLWKSEPDFRRLFDEQEGFCLPHLADLLEVALKKLPKKEQFDFVQAAAGRAAAIHDGVREDLAAFTKSFDYRNADVKVTDRVKLAVERTADYLSAGKK